MPALYDHEFLWFLQNFYIISEVSLFVWYLIFQLIRRIHCPQCEIADIHEVWLHPPEFCSCVNSLENHESWLINENVGLFSFPDFLE